MIGRNRHHRPHDVMIYLPSVTSVLGGSSEPPAGGAEVQMSLLARGLARLGARVSVVAFERPGGLPEFLDGVRIVPRAPYQARCGKAGRLREAAAIHASIAAADAEVVIARGAGPTVALVAGAAKLQRRRFLYSSASLADFDVGRMERKRSNIALFHLGLRLADQLVVQNEEQRALCEHRFRREPVMIKSVAEAAEPRTGAGEAFVWAGRIVWYKQPLAFVELARAVPEAKFWMVCVPEEGDDRRRLLEQVHQAAQDLPNLELLAPRPREEMASLIDRAVAVVNTADFEGLSNTFLEGWGRGVPALALSHDPDALIERLGLGGFAGGSPARLASLAREMWVRRHDPGDLGQRCREYVAHEHSAETIYRRWLDVLDLTPNAIGTRAAGYVPSVTGATGNCA